MISCRLAVEALKILDEEMAARPMIMETGVRDISKLVKLPPNKFDVIDKQASIIFSRFCRCLLYINMITCCRRWTSTTCDAATFVNITAYFQP